MTTIADLPEGLIARILNMALENGGASRVDLALVSKDWLHMIRQTIQKLDFTRLWEVKAALERGLSSFSNLTSLCLFGASATETDICRALSGLKGLKKLRLQTLPNLRSLPCCLSEMAQLEVLLLLWLPSLEDPSPSLGRLTSLLSLTFMMCDKVEALPESVSRLTKLTRLETSYPLPDSLEPVLSKIEELNLWNKTTLNGTTLSFSTRMPRLKRLTLETTRRSYIPDFLTLSPTFPTLALLESLNLLSGTLEGGIPSILGSLPRLSSLSISIEHFSCLPPGFAALKSLTLMIIGGSPEVSSDPLPPNSYSSLEELKLKGLLDIFTEAAHIMRLPAAVGQLKALQTLVVMGAQADLPEIRAISTLKTLRIEGTLESFPLSPAWCLDHLDKGGCCCEGVAL